MGSHLLFVSPPPAQRTRDDPSLEAFQREVAYVFRTLQWLGAQTSEVEDLAQEVFIALRQSWAQYDPSRPLRPYLFGLAFRIVSAQRRKRRREVALPDEDLRDSKPDPHEAFQAKQTRSLLLAALEKVALPRRAVLVMHDLDGASMGEVARALSLPLFTAYSRLRKARKEMADAVRRIFKELRDP